MGNLLPPSMVAIDPFVDLPKYVVPFFKVDTLQEWGCESSPVELSIVPYVPENFQFEEPSFAFVL